MGLHIFGEETSREWTRRQGISRQGQQDKNLEDKEQGDKIHGEGPFEKQLASLFHHMSPTSMHNYVPYFYA